MIEKKRFLSRLFYTIDLLLVVTALVLAYYSRPLLSFLPLKPVGPLRDFLLVLPIILPEWAILMIAFKLHSEQNLFQPVWTALGTVVRINGYGLIALMVILYLLNIQYVNRTLIVLFAVYSVTLLLASVLIIGKFRNFLYSREINRHNVLLVASRDRGEIEEVVNEIRSHQEINFHGVFEIAQKPSAQSASRGGGPQDFESLLHQQVVDEILFLISSEDLPRLAPYVEVCEKMGITARVSADFFRPKTAQIYFSHVYGLPFISFSGSNPTLQHEYSKRIFDFVLSLLLLVSTAPLFLIIAVAIKLTSRGRVFFRQRRAGRNGRIFSMLKFRSMIENAEALKATLVERNIMSGPVFKVENDPRLTPLGKFLRRTSLDELPQLLNVLAGHMSFVGPRPLPVSESLQISGALRRRLAVRPGITCLWQVSGRSNLDFQNWMKLDLRYVDNWSWRLDLEILLRTIPTVLAGKGAR